MATHKGICLVVSVKCTENGQWPHVILNPALELTTKAYIWARPFLVSITSWFRSGVFCLYVSLLCESMVFQDFRISATQGVLGFMYGS